MTVEANTVEYGYVGNGVTSVFPFPSRFLSSSDIIVGVDGVQLTSGYTVLGAGSDIGGSVTISPAPAVGARVSLIRNPAVTQLIDFVNGQTVLEGTLDNSLDKLTMIAQYLYRNGNRALRLGDFDSPPDAGLLLPSADDRRGKILGFDASPDALPQALTPSLGGTGTIIAGSITDSSAAGRAVLTAADEAAQRTVLDVYSKGEVAALPALGSQSNGNRALAAGQDLPRYDQGFMRAAPSVALWEPWSLAPDLISWETPGGVRARITEETVREWVRKEKALGVRAIWFKYVEIFGHWFTEPAFAKWDDRDQVAGALTPGKKWSEFPNNFAELLADDFDMLGVTVDECAKNGMFIIIGLGRVGLFNTMYYYQTGLGGYTGPAALTQAAQMTLAADRTRQLHADIATRFAAYKPWILAFSSGYEPSDMPTWKVFSTAVTTGAGANPTVIAAGYQWWVTPAQMAQLPTAGASLATRDTFALDLIACKADMWIVQDSVGPGNDYVNSRYTYVASVTLGQLPDLYSRWRRSIDDANYASANVGRGIGFGSIFELWRMGSEPPTNLTLSAVSGSAIVATSAFNFFTAAMVGQYITGAAGGNARISAVASLTQATLDTTVAATSVIAAGAAFPGTVLNSGGFSMNTGYANPYPAEPARLAAQIAIHSQYCDEMCLYGSSSFSVPASGTVRLPQVLAGRFAYRTEADANYSANLSRAVTAQSRQRGVRKRLPRKVRVTGSAITPTPSPYTVTQDRYSPAEPNSVVVIRLRLTMYRAKTVNAFVNDITVRLQVNGANVGPSMFTGGENGVFSGTFEAAYELTNTGAAFTYGANVTWQSAAGNPTISEIEWTIDEYLR